MTGKAKIVLLTLLLLGIMLPATGTIPNNQETVYPSGGLIRLHVVANSDSAADQDLKRKVRDEIVHYIAPSFSSAGDIDSARTIALDSLDHIGEISLSKIKAEGKEYPVRVELDSFAFPGAFYSRPFVSWTCPRRQQTLNKKTAASPRVFTCPRQERRMQPLPVQEKPVHHPEKSLQGWSSALK